MNEPINTSPATDATAPVAPIPPETSDVSSAPVAPAPVTTDQPVVQPVADTIEIIADAPAPASTVAPTKATDDSQVLSPEEKLERARLAMEGPERTAKREEREHDTDIKNRLSDLEKKIANLSQKKEELEISWIKLDEGRTGLRSMINPIVDRETKLEADESQLEEQEKNTINEKERLTLEQKRWAIQEQRHKAEEEKWVYESRLFKLEDQIKDNTTNYQKLLDEEEILLREKDELEKNIPR